MDNKNDDRPSLREQAQDEIEKVNWLPEQGKNSIKSMVESRPDWCISRQRSWGVPITLFVHKETGEIYQEMSRLIKEIIAPNIEKEGVIYWRNLDPVNFLEKHAKDIEARDYEKIADTLDVWFDSGVSHYCVLRERSELQFPADLYIEGVDQYRGWFQSSLLSAVALYGHAPYKTVLSHGFTVDAAGHKMSKSLGNVIAPNEIISKYGADILRLWVASSYLHDDIAISQEILARTVDVYRATRNTARFLLGNIFDFNPEKDLVDANKMLSLDRFAVNRVLNLTKDVYKYYDLYQFQHVSGDLQKLLTNEISSFYFSVIKDRLYTMGAASFGRRSAQTALLYILEILVRLIAPILSFTAEEIWQEMREIDKTNRISRCDSVFMSRWEDIVEVRDFDLSEDEITNDDWFDIQNLRDEVNKKLEKLRADGVIGSSLEAEVVLYVDEKIEALLRKLKNDLRFVLITSFADVLNFAAAPKDAFTTEIPGLKLVVKKSSHKKCSRCWHYREDVGENEEHPKLCGRCVSNLFGDGEARSAS
jgi:isoleucyl-tRNA synthetase